MTEAARIIVGQIARSQRGRAFKDEMRVFVRGSGGGDEPGAGHAEVREQVRAVVETEVEHFAFAMGGGEGAVAEIEWSVQDVFFEFTCWRESLNCERKYVGEL